MDLLLHPLTAFGAVACALLAGLYLFVSLKRDLTYAERQSRKRHTDLEAAVRKAQSEIGKLQAAVREAEERAGMLVPPAPIRSGMNISKRAQALRMYRRGDCPETIAASLGIPAGEIELLLKVQRRIVPLERGTESSIQRSAVSNQLRTMDTPAGPAAGNRSLNALAAESASPQRSPAGSERSNPDALAELKADS
jgi:hypothetical protein